jgi:hypothetical protein
MVAKWVVHAEDEDLEPRIVFLVSLPSKQFDRRLVKQQVTFDGG